MTALAQDDEKLYSFLAEARESVPSPFGSRRVLLLMMVRVCGMALMIGALPALLCIGSVSQRVTSVDEPFVMTKYGPVVGTQRITSLGVNVTSFFGIPYASPPLGSLRFRPPQPPIPWSKPLDLSSVPKVSASCLQTSQSPAIPSFGTEDCLKIHAHTPQLLAEGSGALPVMLFIHGGGFVVGSAWENGDYDAKELAQRFKVVVFVAQYRLGVLGFLALEELQKEDPNRSTGNYGVMDQRAAMRWVRENAAAFGGDPTRVTIFGESAGGESMCYHLSSPASHGLFDAAIMESGSCDLQFDTVAKRQLVWQEDFSDLTNCTWGSKGYVDCLRALDGAFLQGLSDRPTKLSRYLPLSGPTIDGTAVGLLDTPAYLLSMGEFNKVPVILGVNRFEFQFMCASPENVTDCMFMNFTQGPRVPSDSEWRSRIEATLEVKLSDTQWGQVLAAYPLQDYAGNRGARLSAMLTDASFGGSNGRSAFIGECGTWRAASDMARAGAPIWMYRMERLGNQAFIQHFSEIPFVFGASGLGSTIEDHAVSELVGQYWTNLAKFHDPNGRSVASQSIPHWPVLDTSAPLLAHFDGAVPHLAPPSRAKWCDFWQKLLAENIHDAATFV